MVRFMRKGKTKVYFVPTIAVLTAPTVAEITAGTALHGSLKEITGFTFQNNPIETPDMGSAFVTKIGGEDTVEDSSMTFYEDDTATTLITALAKGTVGNVVIFYKGTAGVNPAAADKAEVWPAVITSNARQYTVDNEAAAFMVAFANTAAPSQATLAA